MILRSGLIRNRDEIPETAFNDHWLHVHGPLARLMPNLRAYSQNHIVARFPTPPSGGLHRIDGISQLRFDDVAVMTKAMASPEQQACIEDIKGFLSAVTLLIMQPQEVVAGPGDAGMAKLMTVLAGDPAANADYAEATRRGTSQAGVLRATHNAVIDRGHAVDLNVPKGEQVAVAMAEFWFASAAALESAVTGGLLDSQTHLLRPLATFAVVEHRLL